MSSVFLLGSFRFKMRLIVSKLCRWLSHVSSRLNYTYGVRNFKKSLNMIQFIMIAIIIFVRLYQLFL